MTDGPHFGLTGLAVMGANLARNLAHHGIPVAVHNRTVSRTERFMAEHGEEGPIIETGSVGEFVAALERPRTIMTMVKAGPPVDAVIDELLAHLEKGDTVVDGGNSHFRDTQRRARALADQGLRFLGVGVSGGE
jgi:6-phosphogluconate dehydrogenase